MFEKKRRAPDPREDGLAEIARWREWFVSAHALRLSRPWEFADAHLADAELKRITAQADAIAARMTSDFLARIRPR